LIGEATISTVLAN